MTACAVCTTLPGFTAATLLFLIGLALIFDFLNGFHDAANSIATVVSTGVLRPYQAVVWAAFFNLLAFALFKLNVAATIGKGILAPEFVDAYVIGSALTGAIAWNLITWYFGIPSSSSHALIGGMIGAGVAKAGTAPLVWAGIVKTLVFIVISPLLGLLLGAAVMIAVSWIFFRRSPYTVDVWFRRLQLVSSALYSVGHGSNDAQKTMGLIWLMLISSGAASNEHIPLWVVGSSYTAMALGTLFGGWRIVRTMGQRITKQAPTKVIGELEASMRVLTRAWNAPGQFEASRALNWLYKRQSFMGRQVEDDAHDFRDAIAVMPGRIRAVANHFPPNRPD